MTAIIYKKSRRYDESKEQISFMQELMLRDKDAWSNTWWTPNERQLSPQSGARHKAMGRKSGVPDIFMAIPRKGFHGLFIEMKRKDLKGKKSTTDNQDIFLERLSGNGYKCQVCYGAEEAIKCAIDYLT